MNHSSETSNSNDQQYNQPQQYEPLLCQTSNSNGVDHYCLMFHRGVVKHEIQNVSLTYQMKVCYYQHIGPGNMGSLLLMVCNTLQKDINHLNFGPMKQVTVYIRSHYAVK
jgi:hypothetical protein